MPQKKLWELACKTLEAFVDISSRHSDKNRTAWFLLRARILHTEGSWGNARLSMLFTSLIINIHNLCRFYSRGLFVGSKGS